VKYTPFNRHLVLEECGANEETSIPKVLVPDDYKSIKDHGIYRIVGMSLDCSTVFATGARVVVEESMVRTIDLGTEKTFLISENFVLLYESE